MVGQVLERLGRAGELALLLTRSLLCGQAVLTGEPLEQPPLGLVEGGVAVRHLAHCEKGIESALPLAAAKLSPEVRHLRGTRRVAQCVAARDGVVQRLAIKGHEERVVTGAEARQPVVRPAPVVGVLVGVPAGAPRVL